MAHAVSPTGKVKQIRSLEPVRISIKSSESNKTIGQEDPLVPQVSESENEMLESKIEQQQSEKEIVTKQSEDQNESDDHKETKKNACQLLIPPMSICSRKYRFLVREHPHLVEASLLLPF